MTDPNKTESRVGLRHRVLNSIYHVPKEKMHPLGYWAAVVTIVLAVTSLPFWSSIYGWWHPTIPPPIQLQTKYRVLVPLAATSSEYLAFIRSNGGTYDGPYNNKASQNIREIVKVAKTQWFADQVSTQGVFKEDDVDFFFFPEGYPEGNESESVSYQTAFQKAMDTAKTDKREVVAVLGNVSSTSTVKYGKFCGEKKLPMILPLATATDITHSLDVLKVPAVLRLPPANDKQAKEISDFLLRNRVRRTVIVKDISNDAYSRDLVQGFREYYVEKPLSSPDRRNSDDFGQIVGVVPVAGQETGPFLYPALGNSPETALLIIGMTNSSIETIAQVNALRSNYKYIIFTDGAVDQYLGPQIKAIQGISRLSNLYLSFPSPCTMPKPLAGYLARDANLRGVDFEMTHALFVADGSYIILSMLSKGVRANPAKPGNEILTAAITELKDQARQREEDKVRSNPQDKIEEPIGHLVDCPLPFSESGKREYEVDKFGNAVNGHYFLYSIGVVTTGGQKHVEWKRATGQNSSQCPEEPDALTIPKLRHPIR